MLLPNRQQKRDRVRGVRVDFESVEPNLTTEPDGLGAAAWSFDARDLYAALGRLPREHRTALLLFYVGGFAYAEIAGIMGTPLWGGLAIALVWGAFVFWKV